jgi:hypothetical protein
MKTLSGGYAAGERRERLGGAPQRALLMMMALEAGFAAIHAWRH